MYCRTSIDDTSCASQQDHFTIDNEGNVNEDIVWDFQNITKITLFPIPDEKLIFENASVYTIVDSKDYSHKNNVEYIARGIRIERSNVELSNLEHKYLNTSKKEISVMNTSYNGFISAWDVANVTLTDISLRAMKSKAKNNNSTYDLNLQHAVNITMVNVRIPENQLTNKSLWHVTGTNRTKNIVYDGCWLNGYDAHKGVHNLTIKNSKIGSYRVNVVGSGTLMIDNCTIQGTNNIVALNDAYGSSWNGQIVINNSHFYPNFIWDSRSDYYGSRKTSIMWYILVEHDYGYDIYLPNIIVNNLTVYNNPDAIYIYPNDKFHSGCSEANLKYATYYCYSGKINRNINIPKSITVKNIIDQNGNSLINKVLNYSIPF